jgi:DNA-binding LytR/AlgR family response regulator
MTRVAIVEDEKQYSDELAGFIRQYAKERNELIDTVCFENGMEFIEYIDGQTERFDVVFMDVKMPYVNGLNAAKYLRDRDKYVSIIFTTVMTQYATRGYEVDALDYMVKPIKYLNFSLKMDKAIARAVNSRSIITLPDSDGGMVRLKTVEVHYIESMDHYCIFHTEAGEYRKIVSLAAVEEQFRADGFLRCNNSFLINPVFVSRLTKNSVVIKGVEIPISRRKHKFFMDEIAKYFG